MEVNVDKMLLEQSKRLKTIDSQKLIYEDKTSVGVVYADFSNTIYNTSNTNMMIIDDVLTLTRTISSYIYRVEFNCETRCCDIVDWFRVTDGDFIKCSKRTTILKSFDGQ